MKKIFMLFLLNISVFVYSQENKKHKVEYINMSSLSVAKNTESYFSNFSRDSIKSFDGIGFDINTIHGAKFFGHFSISVGMGLDWNINKTFLSTPLIVDLRVFSSKNSDNSLFAFLQTGQNIKWSNSFNGNGTASKLGVGAIFSQDENISYFLDIYKKSKQIELIDSKDKGNYNISGFGISLGIIF
jgi:hypothetical protein